MDKNVCKQQFYNWEDILVLLMLVTSSQPCLIFSIFFLKHGRSSMALHIRTTIGRKTAIIKFGGVYHTNCFISTHLFQAKTNACIVPSRRETIPSLLCKRKKNYLGEIGSFRVYSILYHLDLFRCLEILPFISICFPITFLDNVHSYFHYFYMWVMPLSPGYLSWENSQPFSFWSQKIDNIAFPFSIPCSSLLWHLFYDALSLVHLP